VNLDDVGVHHGAFHLRIVRESVETRFENIGFRPFAEPLEDGVLVAERRRKVPPRATRARDPQHCFKKHAAISSGSARVRGFAQAKRFDLRPLGVR
jgi:hypothetical protein